MSDNNTNKLWNLSSSLPSGEQVVTDVNGNPIDPLVTEQISGGIPTNDWWSSLTMPFFGDQYSAPMQAHPLSMQAESEGLALGYTSEPKFIASDTDPNLKYEYTYHTDLKVGLDNLQADATKVAGYSDWAVTAEWADNNSSDKLQATIGHGMPFVYFEREGSSDIEINLVTNNANAISQPNQTTESLELTGINGQYTGGEVGFDLLLNAIGENGSEVGNAVQAKISIDSNGDGQFDYIETFNFIPLDAAAGSTEHYLQTEGRGVGESTFGSLTDLSNATIKFDVWRAFGEGQIEIAAGDESQIKLPFTNLTDSNGQSLSNNINFVSDPAIIDNLVLGAEDETIWYQSDNVLGITINGNHYGLFAPSGSHWQIENETILRNDLAGKDYLSVAILPDNSIETLEYFKEHAYAFVKDTKIEYQYDQETAEVITNFNVTTELKEEGYSDDPLLSLYRHQWLKTDEELTDFSYNSPRGEMKLMEGSEFTTTDQFSGILPTLPNVMSEENIQVLKGHIDQIYQALQAKSEVITAEDTYWSGKDMGELSELAKIADQVGHTEARDFFIDTVKNELQDWFTADSGTPGDKQFFLNEVWGTLQGYPASFHSETQINDHHFHYGYFVQAAATVSQFDPNWANEWGGIVDLLIQDVANTDRESSDFPFLRNFDPYAGHFWASGHGAFASGNNQESSSEAMNFAGSVIAWGQVTGNPEITSLGVYLYTTQLATIEQYWFDVDNAVFPSQFDHQAIGIVWGDGGAYSTFFSAQPEMIQGINFLPITGNSLYLGRYPEYIESNYQELIANNGGIENDWVDIIWAYQALANPQDALQKFLASAQYNGESGDSYPHTFHWLTNLNELGQIETGITANTPYYSVFSKDGVLTYTAFNPTNDTLIVTFSDGTQLELLPREFVANSDLQQWSSISGLVAVPDDSTDDQTDNAGDNSDNTNSDNSNDQTPPTDDTGDTTDEEPTNNEQPSVLDVTPTQLGTAGNDTLHGTAENDVLSALAGADYLHGNFGNDTLLGGDGDDYLYGVNGNDILVGGAGRDFMVGGEGADTYLYTAINESTKTNLDRIESFESGSDLFDFSRLDLTYDNLYTVQVNGFTQILSNNSDFGVEIVLPYTLNENDFIFASDVNQQPTDDNEVEEPEPEPEPEPVPEPEPEPEVDPTITGDEQNNVLSGTIDNDIISSAGGDDVLYGYQGDDQLIAGDGNDHLHGHQGNDLLQAGDGNDYLHGNSGDDTLYGGLGDDYLHGNEDNDSLYGGAGNDFLYGNEGNDILNGGAGGDFLVGGAGSDVFAFNSITDSTTTNRDRIEGFVSGEDKLDFSQFYAQPEVFTISQEYGNYVVTMEGTDFAVELVATANVTTDDFIF